MLVKLESPETGTVTVRFYKERKLIKRKKYSLDMNIPVLMKFQKKWLSTATWTTKK